MSGEKHLMSELGRWINLWEQYPEKNPDLPAIKIAERKVGEGRILEKTEIEIITAALKRGADEIRGIFEQEFAELLGPHGDSFGNLVEQSKRFSPLQTDNKTFAIADTSLRFTEWAEDFVHGPDTILPIGHLAEKILAPDEEFMGLQSIRWRKIMTHGLSLTVSSEPFPYDPSAITLDGTLITSKRKLYFMGTSKPSITIPQKQLKPNPYAVHVYPPYLSYKPLLESAGQLFPQLDFDTEIEPLPTDIRKGLLASPSLTLSTYAEMVAGILQTTHLPGVKERFITGMSNISLEPNRDELVAKGGKAHVHIDYAKKRTSPSGYALLPFEITLPWTTKPISGYLALK